MHSFFFFFFINTARGRDPNILPSVYHSNGKLDLWNDPLENRRSIKRESNFIKPVKNIFSHSSQSLDQTKRIKNLSPRERPWRDDAEIGLAFTCRRTPKVILFSSFFTSSSFSRWYKYICTRLLGRILLDPLLITAI